METKDDDKKSDEGENDNSDDEKLENHRIVEFKKIEESKNKSNEDVDTIVIEEILDDDSNNSVNKRNSSENKSKGGLSNATEENEDSIQSHSEEDMAEYQSSMLEYDEDEDPTQCAVYNVIVLDEQDSENAIVINDSSDDSEEEEECPVFDNQPETSLEPTDHLKVIAEEGFVVCQPNEVEPVAFSSNSVFDTDVKGSECNVKKSLEVSLSLAVYPPLEKLPDKNGAFIFNGHKYYIVKDRRPHITYYECWRSRRNGSCKVKCRVSGEGIVEIKGEHDHPPINPDDINRTKFKQSLMNHSLSASENIPLEELYNSVANEYPDATKLLPFSQAKRLMEVSRHTVYNTPLRRATQKLQGKYYPPDPERRVVTGRGFFLDGFKYYKMGNGLTHEVFRCAEARRSKCRVYCRVNKEDWSACVSGEHNHLSVDGDGSGFLVSSFKLELRKMLSDPSNYNLSAKDIYDKAAKLDPVGADLFPYKDAKQYIYMRKINVTPVPPTPENPSIAAPSPQYFIHQNFKYELLRKRTGKRAMYYKCTQAESGCQVNLRILGDGTVVVVGKHSHEPEPEIEMERQRLMDTLQQAVLNANPNDSLQRIYDSLMSRETPDKMLIYPWKQAWNFMKGIQRTKIKVEEPEIVEEIQEQIEVEYHEVEPIYENGEEQRVHDKDDSTSRFAHQKIRIVPRGLYTPRKPRGRMRAHMITDREQADAVENLLNYGRQVRKNISTPPRKRGRRRASYSLDTDNKRIAVNSDHSEEVKMDVVQENLEGTSYHEVLVNVEGFTEPALVFVENAVVSEEVVIEETVQ